MTFSRKPKTPTVEVNRRVGVIENMLLNGFGRRQIIQYAAMEEGEKKAWNLSDRQIDTYIERAKKQIEEDALPEREFLIKAALRRYNDLYGKSHNIGDYRTCTVVQAHIDKLMGLNAPENVKHNISGEDGQPIQFIWQPREENGKTQD